MSRQKQKGTEFENQVLAYLQEQLGDDFHRLAPGGTKDEGDIYGLFSHGKRVVVECKNRVVLDLATWLRETEVERGNADALAGICVHKRRGVGAKSTGNTYVTMSLRDLVAIIKGEREHGSE